jgi:hypothetical protein
MGFVGARILGEPRILAPTVAKSLEEEPKSYLLIRRLFHDAPIPSFRAASYVLMSSIGIISEDFI